MKTHIILFGILMMSFTACNNATQANQETEEVEKTETAPAPASELNTLSDAETAAGWKLLFDGKTFSGWHGYLQEGTPSAWTIEDGAMVLTPKADRPEDMTGGDILTDEEYENYELSIEWKIQDCGNSGIMFNVVESEEYNQPYYTGPEMQVLDNKCHPDAEIITHRAGDLYDMISCSEETVKPAGEWNQARLVINNGKAEHWLNGKKVVEYEMFTSEWNEMIAESKFKAWKAFGQARKGRIDLQDHSDRVWYRNIKIREL